MGGPVRSTRTFLLKYMHITKLRIEMRGKHVSDSSEESVLIKRIVNNLFPKIQEDLIHNRDEWNMSCQFFTF